MSNNNHRFTITDEPLEWDQDQPLSSPEAPDEPSVVRSETVESSERKRTVLIASVGGVAGGLLVAVVMSIVAPPSSSQSASPQHTADRMPAKHASHATVIGPAHQQDRRPEAAHHTPVHHHVAGKKPQRKHPHNRKGTRAHHSPAATARIHSRPRKHESNHAHHHRRTSK